MPLVSHMQMVGFLKCNIRCYYECFDVQDKFMVEGCKGLNKGFWVSIILRIRSPFGNHFAKSDPELGKLLYSLLTMHKLQERVAVNWRIKISRNLRKTKMCTPQYSATSGNT